MEFDHVSITRAGGSDLLTAEQFMRLPVEERVNLIAAGKVDFIKDGAIIPRETILEGLAEAGGSDASGSYLMVLNEAGEAIKRIPLTSEATSLGKTGKRIGVVVRTAAGYVLRCIEGTTGLLLNGRVVPSEGVKLRNGDILSVIGTRLQFYS